MVQDSSAPRLAGQVFVSEKKPPILMLVIVSVVLPVLVSVAVLGLSWQPPGRWVLQINFMPAGSRLTVVPVPSKTTVCGLPGPLSVIESVPVTRSIAPGVKVTPMLQLAPAARLEAQVLVSSNLLVALIFEMLSVCVPLLIIVTVCAELVVPKSWVGKVRLAADRIALGPVTSPGCNRMDTVEPVESPTAKSGLPSPLKSPTASESGR